MRVLLTPSELANAISTSTRAEGGLVVLEFPDDAMEPRDDRPILANPHLVRYRGRELKVTPTEHILLRFILEHGPSDLESVVDAVWWGKQTSDKCIRSHASRISCQFFDAEIPFEVTVRGGFVSLQRTDGGVPATMPASGQLRDFLDSEGADALTPGMRLALQMILRHDSISVGDLAELGVFRGQPPSTSAIKSFRTRINGILVEAGLTLSYSEADHVLRVSPV